MTAIGRYDRHRRTILTNSGSLIFDHGRSSQNAQHLSRTPLSHFTKILNETRSRMNGAAGSFWERRMRTVIVDTAFAASIAAARTIRDAHARRDRSHISRRYDSHPTSRIENPGGPRHNRNSPMMQTASSAALARHRGARLSGCDSTPDL